MNSVEGLGRYFLSWVLDIITRLLRHVGKVDLIDLKLEWCPVPFVDHESAGNGACLVFGSL